MKQPTWKQLAWIVGGVGLIVILAVSGLIFIVFASPQGISNSAISPTEVRSLTVSDSTVVLLDVRTRREYSGETGHLRNAILIPVQELDNRIGELAPYKSRTIVVYCRTGHRSATAAGILREHGFEVRNMDGGITRWLKESLPVDK